jgi:hypothetical protein
MHCETVKQFVRLIVKIMRNRAEMARICQKLQRGKLIGMSVYFLGIFVAGIGPV